LNFGFNDRCQFQLKHHQLGENEKQRNRFVAPSRPESGRFCCPDQTVAAVCAAESLNETKLRQS
jgi:hypothetical protein